MYYEIAVLFCIHMIFTLLIANHSTKYLHHRFSTSTKRVFLFVVVFNIALPIIGYISTVWILYYLKNVQYVQEIQDVNILDLELFEYDFINVQREFGEGSLQEMLSNKYIPTEKKIKALVLLSEDLSQNNIQIIKNTLSSYDDEVRLYGFAIIDKIERNINGKIYEILKKFQNATSEIVKASLAKELAFLYWELIYFEISDTSLKNYILSEVKKYISIATSTFKDDPKIHILAGRVHMLEKDYTNASSQFTLANELSPEKLSFIMPYLAESNFISGHYEVVKSIIKEARDLNFNSKLYPIVEQWSA